MTPARKHALKWFYDRGAVIKDIARPEAPSTFIRRLMHNEGQLELTPEGWCLTDKGRRDLWAAEMEQRNPAA